MAVTSSENDSTGTDPTPDDTRTGLAADGSTRGHIGRIVTGTMLGGFLAAIVLVTLPLAGAREHVITGSVLLMFAASWLALAVLALRWTDQPQRWAFVPATFMGVSGAAVLILAPTGNELGWIWPPVVMVLAVWMMVRARRELHSRTRRWIVYPVCLTLALSCIGGVYETARESTDNLPMAGRLVDVGGHRLHIDCRGSGGPTVVLEPGLGETSTDMAWISKDLGVTTRVCVYDRAGRGWSESADGPQDGVDVATDLHTLLARAGERGPFVLAGHSAGGIYVMNFAHLYPEQVAGVVLLDSMHPDQYSRITSWPAFYETFRRATGVLPAFSRLGLGRLMYASGYGGLPPKARDAARAFNATPRGARSVRDEFSELRSAMAQAKKLRTLGDRPLVVMTAKKDAQGGWMAAQNQLATFSTNCVHRVLRNASHAMVTEDEATAARASRAISDVVHSVRTGTPLTTKAVKR